MYSYGTIVGHCNGEFLLVPFDLGEDEPRFIILMPASSGEVGSANVSRPL